MDPIWLQIAVGGLTVCGAIIGVVAWVFKKTYKAKVLSDRPYPCVYVQDLADKVQRHDAYLSSDRKRIESLEKAEIRLDTQFTSAVQDIKDIKNQNQQILNLLIQGKME